MCQRAQIIWKTLSAVEEEDASVVAYGSFQRDLKASWCLCICNRNVLCEYQRVWKPLCNADCCSTLRDAVLNDCFVFIVGNLSLDWVCWSHPSAETCFEVNLKCLVQILRWAVTSRSLPWAVVGTWLWGGFTSRTSLPSALLITSTAGLGLMQVICKADVQNKPHEWCFGGAVIFFACVL